MKILLVGVNAKYIHSCPAVYSLRASCSHPEMVDIAEFTINDRYQDILAGILEREADLIGFSTYIWNTDIIQDLTADIRRVRGEGAVLFAGGPEASYAPERFLGSCDFVVCWEGEKPFRMITGYAARFEEIDLRTIKANVPGLAFYEEDRIIITPAEPETNDDINEIPFLYDDLELFNNRIIYYESSRGCPFNCTYCLSSIDKQVRFREIDKVLRELQYFIDREVPQVKFIDRTFNCSHERTMTIWTYLRDHDNGKTNFHFEIGADLLNEAELSLLEGLRPGLVQLEIGIQSTNPDTLEAIRRTTDLPRLFSNIERLRRAQNINLHVDLIAGLPYEGFETFARSFNDVYGLHADQLQLGFLKVLSGTAMHAMAEEIDIRYSQRPPYEVLSTRWISYSELDRLRRICDVLEYYYNSRQFIHTLLYLERYWKSAFGFFRDLADFFRMKGYDKAKPAAGRRYEVLEEFVRDYGFEKKPAGENLNMDVFREYLRFDRALHIHKNRRNSVCEEYDFGEGKVRITVRYDKKNRLTGEAFYIQE